MPRAIALAAFRRQRRNPGITALREVRGRGHSLTIDGGWREVADLALAFVRQHQPARSPGAGADREGAPRAGPDPDRPTA